MDLLLAPTAGAPAAATAESEAGGAAVLLAPSDAAATAPTAAPALLLLKPVHEGAIVFEVVEVASDPEQRLGLLAAAPSPAAAVPLAPCIPSPPVWGRPPVWRSLTIVLRVAARASS